MDFEKLLRILTTGMNLLGLRFDYGSGFKAIILKLWLIFIFGILLWEAISGFHFFFGHLDNVEISVSTFGPNLNRVSVLIRLSIVIYYRKELKDLIKGLTKLTKKSTYQKLMILTN
jgi:hypothetical protein